MSEETFKTTLYEEIKDAQCEAPSIPELPFVSFELNLRTLQEFLAQLLAAVNKNTVQIKVLQEEVGRKVAFQDLAKLVDSVSAIFPAEQAVSKTESKDINDLVAMLTAGTQKMCDKVALLEKFKENAENDISELWERLKEKLDSHSFGEEKKKIVEMVEGRVKDDKFNKQVKRIKDKFNEKEENNRNKWADIDKRLSEIKTEFLWKLNDCDRLLQTRVNEQFVWDAVEVLENKLGKQRDVQVGLQMSNQQALFEKFQSSLKGVESKLGFELEASKSFISLVEKE